MYQAYFDGSSKGNPGPSRAAFVITDNNGPSIIQEAVNIGNTTNNVAEYKALIMLLEKLCTEKLFPVTIQGDSKLVIEQLTGCWKVKAPHLRELAIQARGLLKQLPADEWKMKWVRRDYNIADSLAQNGI